MKTVFISVVAFLLVTNVTAQTNKLQFDKSLADSLGADDYGMKMYVLVILKPRSVKIADKKKADSLFSGHMQNIGRLADIGKLIVAGPIKKNKKNYEGLFILNCKTVEEAHNLLDTDPAIKAKFLSAELFQWYGSAALALYMKFHDAVKKKSF